MGLRENIWQETVAQLPLREAITVKPSTPIRQVAAKMRHQHLGCAFLVDAKGKPVGKFTERRLMRALLDDPANLDQPVEKFSYPTVDVLKRSDSIARMVQVMQSKQLRFMCVVDDKGRVEALTGQKGLMEYIAEHFPRRVKVEQLKSKLYMDDREGA
jgi:predicted transcriptional regulator